MVGEIDEDGQLVSSLAPTAAPATQIEPPPPPPPLLSRLNRHGFRLIHVADVVMLLTIMVATMLVRHGVTWPDYSMTLYLLSFAFTAGVFMATFYFGGLYEREPRLGEPPVLPRAARLTSFATGLWAVMELGLTSLATALGYETQRALPMPIPNLIVLLILASVGVALNRRMAKWLRYNREGPPRVLLVGAPDDVNVARSHIASDGHRAVVVGEAFRVTDLLGRVEEVAPTDIALVSSQSLDTVYPDLVARLEEVGVHVLQRVTAKETMFGLERVRQIGGMPFVLLRSHTLPISRARFKRFTDLAFLTAMSPFVLVALALVALYQLIVVGRPVLFWQNRVGVDGRSFRMVKFRTMYPSAEEDGNPQLATQDDPRIVPACRWLRATRLDELPQVINIVRGEMSLVGPRPERPELTTRFEELIPGYARRHEIPPGLTGLAQIHGRYHTDPEYKLGYDLQYLVNWSPVLDIEILLRTVWVVVTRRI